MQEGKSTCGPVTLLNILHLKGDFSRTEEELSQLCETKLNVGTSHENMVKAAKHLGLEVVEEKDGGTMQDVEQHIDNGNFVVINYFHAFSQNGHYGLVSEYEKIAFYLRDCSLGLLRLRREYFKKYWHDQDRNSYGWFMAVK